MIKKYELEIYEKWKSKEYSLVIIGNTFYIIENKKHWFKYKNQFGQLKHHRIVFSATEYDTYYNLNLMFFVLESYGFKEVEE